MGFWSGNGKELGRISSLSRNLLYSLMKRKRWQSGQEVPLELLEALKKKGGRPLENFNIFLGKMKLFGRAHMSERALTSS